MFRLIRLTILLMIICAAVIFAARLVGRTQPVPLAILFTNPNGTPCQRPCLFGVQPGVTNFSDAVAMVRAHPFTRALGRDELSDQGQSYITFGGEVMTISVNTGSDDRVSSIDIVFIIATLYAKPEPLLGSNTLGEFAALSGVPNSIETRNGYTLARYSNDNMSVVSLNSLVNGEWVISAENQLSSITLEASDVFEQRLKLSRSRLSPWRGFSDVRRYALTANP